VISWGSANDLGKSLKVIIMFLKMCLLFRSFLIWSCWLSNWSPVWSKARKIVWPVLLQYLDKAVRPSSLFKTSFWRIDHLGFWVCHFCEPFVCQIDTCLGLYFELYLFTALKLLSKELGGFVHCTKAVKQVVSCCVFEGNFVYWLYMYCENHRVCDQL